MYSATVSPAPPLSEDIRQRVNTVLTELEETRHVRVLYACESGSRAWGFASPDSDYDVRFLYVHTKDWYLSVEDKRDVLELPLSDELDVSGWELRKALRLLRKSNPSLLEWMQSPLVYRQDDVFTSQMQLLTSTVYSPRRCFQHYLHMAYGNWRAYLLNREQVSLKKYLYVFRPVLACRWLERSLGQVPMLFSTLVETVLEETDVRSALTELVALKQASHELGVCSPVPVLSDFLAKELARLDSTHQPEDYTVDVAQLNAFFRQQLS